MTAGSASRICGLLTALWAGCAAPGCSKWRTLSECDEVIDAVNPRLEAIRQDLEATEQGSRTATGDAGVGEVPTAARDTLDLPPGADTRRIRKQYQELVDALQALELKHPQLDAAVKGYTSMLKATVRELKRLQPKSHETKRDQPPALRRRLPSAPTTRAAAVVEQGPDTGPGQRPGVVWPRPSAVAASPRPSGVATDPVRPAPALPRQPLRASKAPAPPLPKSSLVRAIEREKSLVEKIDRICHALY